MRSTLLLAQVLGLLCATACSCSSADFAASEPADSGSTDEDAPTDVAVSPDIGDSGCVPPAAAACNPTTHCGCAANQKCDTVAGTTGCLAIGTGSISSACKSTTDCARDLTCLGGRCARKCTYFGGTECTDLTGTRCGRIVDLQSRLADVCASDCDPTALAALGSGCGSAAACRVSHPDVFRAETYCEAKFGTAGDREVCATDADCKPNFFCSQTVTGNLLCWKWCRVGVAGACPSGQTCKANTPKTTVTIRGASFELGGCSP